MSQASPTSSSSVADSLVAQVILTRRVRRYFSWLLMYWSLGSMAVGGLLIGILSSFAFWEAQGWQHLIWGAIDIVFAVMGVRQARVAGLAGLGEEARQAELSDRDKLVKALGVSMKMNWGWLACGVGLIIWGVIANMSRSLLGHGAGVLIQAGFLTLMDRAYVKSLTAAR